MKTPLRYQITEFDCGSVSLLNCITYLFKRNEIPAELVKAISSYSLDCYDEFGNLGHKGTSREAVQYICRWMVNFSKSKNFGVVCEYYSKDEVTLEKIHDCIKKGGCVNLRTYQGCEHYVIITKIDKNFVYIFDPYYSKKTTYKNNKFITFIENQPFKYNRKVKMERFLSDKKQENALGPIENRECVLFFRTQ